MARNILICCLLLQICATSQLATNHQRTSLSPTSCPTSLCPCLNVTQTGGRIINCRNKQLDTIPYFSISNEAYAELTFSSAESTGCFTCNKITNIPPYAFQNVKISKLDLTKNPISTFSEEGFFGLENELQELYLEGDGRQQIPHESLRNLRVLSLLHLENFRQVEMNADSTLPMLPELLYLTLTAIKDLTLINSNAFINKLPKLVSLTVTDVSLTLLPAGAIQTLTTLQHIKVTDTLIQTIYGYSFSHLDKLTSLDLSHNQYLDTIHHKAFTDVSNTLVSLNLAFNSFQDLTFLRTHHWGSLTTLDLGYLPLYRIEPDTFKQMPNLQTLNLQSTKLHVLEKSYFNDLSQLVTLDLSYNYLANITNNVFTNTPKLIKIIFQTQQLPKGKKVYLSKEAFQGLENSLTHLNLDSNILEAEGLWEVLPMFRSLTYLSLQHTDLRAIPDHAFKDNVNLKELYLSDNKISEIRPETFEGLEKSVSLLSLSSNRIQTIDECVFRKFDNQIILLLDANDLTCDCRLLWLYDRLQMMKQTSLFPYITNVACFLPQNLHQQFLYSIDKSQLTCDENYIKPVCSQTDPSTSPVKMAATSPTLAVNILNFSIVKESAVSVKLSWSLKDETFVTGYHLSVMSQIPAYQPWEITLPDTKTYVYTVSERDVRILFCITGDIRNVPQRNDTRCEMWQREQTEQLVTESGGEVVQVTFMSKMIQMLAVLLALAISVYLTE